MTGTVWPCRPYPSLSQVHLSVVLSWRRPIFLPHVGGSQPCVGGASFLVSHPQPVHILCCISLSWLCLLEEFLNFIFLCFYSNASFLFFDLVALTRFPVLRAMDTVSSLSEGSSFKGRFGGGASVFPPSPPTLLLYGLILPSREGGAPGREVQRLPAGVPPLSWETSKEALFLDSLASPEKVLQASRFGVRVGSLSVWQHPGAAFREATRVCRLRGSPSPNTRPLGLPTREVPTAGCLRPVSPEDRVWPGFVLGAGGVGEAAQPGCGRGAGTPGEDPQTPREPAEGGGVSPSPPACAG